jgi:hypothetical protein
VLRSDGFGDAVEEELLWCGIGSVSLKPDVVGTVAFCNSLHWKSGSDVEWSIDMESELLVESFSWFLACLVNILNSPLLLDFVFVDWLIFNMKAFYCIFICINGTSKVDEHLVFISVYSELICEFSIHVVCSCNQGSAISCIFLEDLVTLSGDSFSFAVELPFLSGLSISGLGMNFTM